MMFHVTNNPQQIKKTTRAICFATMHESPAANVRIPTSQPHVFGLSLLQPAGELAILKSFNVI